MLPDDRELLSDLGFTSYVFGFCFVVFAPFTVEVGFHIRSRRGFTCWWLAVDLLNRLEQRIVWVDHSLISIVSQSCFTPGFVTAPFAAEPKVAPYFASTPDV